MEEQKPMEEQPIEPTKEQLEAKNKETLAKVLSNIKDNNFSFYFFTLDTMGNPVAGVANIYEHVKVLNELGYKAYILHEKDDYKLHGNETGMGLSDWLGAEYAELPHVSIENQNLNITPADYVIIPEIFANVMDQVKQFPCKKIVFSQAYDYLLELLPIGKRWHMDYGFSDVITTSQKQSDYVTGLFPGMTPHIVPVGIADYFKPSEKPKIPVISIVTRNPSDAKKIANAFYLQFPIYKFVTFRELRGLPKEQFAEELGKSCLAVWIDDPSGFGTFPLEAMQCETPVIGKIPNMIPEWMEAEDEGGIVTLKTNGIWTNTTLNISELIGTFMKVWLEDTTPSDIIDGMRETNGTYTMEKQKAAIKKVYGNIVKARTVEFEKAIAKTEVKEETKEETKV